jgi:hypothetical protein
MMGMMTLVIAGIVLLSAGLAIVYRKSPVLHYRIHHDGPSLYRILCTRLKPGDSYRKAILLLGSGKEASDMSRERFLLAAQKRPEFFPDGVFSTDVLLDYPYSHACWTRLQFRDGQLVNFEPGNFTRYVPPRPCMGPLIRMLPTDAPAEGR